MSDKVVIIRRDGYMRYDIALPEKECWYFEIETLDPPTGPFKEEEPFDLHGAALTYRRRVFRHVVTTPRGIRIFEEV